MNIKLNHNRTTKIINVFFNSIKTGDMYVLDDKYRCFPCNTDQLSGDNYIALGKILNQMNTNPCAICKHDGNQAVFKSGCTGCAVDSEYGNFEHEVK